jgi:hypothetical protein
MKADDESFRTLVIAWVVIVTVFLAILLPYTLNVPTLPALFYKTVTKVRPTVVSQPGILINHTASANPDGLLVWYDFEDDLAKTHRAGDRSGSNNPAYVKGLFIGNGPGIIGNSAVSLSGSGYLFSDQNPVPGRTNVTFSLWFTEGDPGRNERLVSAVSATDPQTGWILGTRSSELWDGSGDPVRIPSGMRLEGTPAFAPWNHKAVVYDGSSVREYLNGQVMSEYAATGKPLGAGREMEIGSWQPFGQNYAGRIDEFRVYDRALNESQVLDLYRQGNPAAAG